MAYNNKNDVGKVTIYGEPDFLIYAARAAQTVQARNYQWPADGITMFQYSGVVDVALKRNKAGISIWTTARIGGSNA